MPKKKVHYLWFVIDDGKVIVGPESEAAARSWYERKRDAYKPEFQHRVALMEGIIREQTEAVEAAKPPAAEPPTHRCENCDMTERMCTKRIMQGKDACCERCAEDDMHGFGDRTVTDLYTIEQIAEMGRKK